MLVQDAKVQRTYVETVMTPGYTALYVIRLSTENHEDKGTCSAQRGYENYIQNCSRKSKTEDIIRPRRRWRDNIQWTSRHRMNQYNGFIYFRTAIYKARRKQKVNGAPCYKQSTVLNKHSYFNRSDCQQNGLLLYSVDRTSLNDSW
jgi:hypothetical protein